MIRIVNEEDTNNIFQWSFLMSLLINKGYNELESSSSAARILYSQFFITFHNVYGW